MVDDVPEEVLILNPLSLGELSHPTHKYTSNGIGLLTRCKAPHRL